MERKEEREMDKKTSGDVLRLYITPPGDTYPAIQIFKHRRGIKEKASPGRWEAGAQKGKSRKAVALEIGKAVIRSSRVLKAWFKN